ncbi:PAPS reductase/FAD synthetase family protein [Aciduliprofundum sp. MAR08-339]|uniref:phosphoadenosine phosphosulfate reductase domain-containing protein n=1 Tax=Aciduliprofundum sp. (strain MAR08-339) TaxID=673860 RepID=UPI0002A4C7F4|nr:PAPS reductase/FAD synthetase family protein [Aciduliprofundum sp. MAR08-339]
MGRPVYLGKIKLYWCDECNVPLVSKGCGICGNEGRRVEITPPGEVRIGFEGDLKLLNRALEKQFGTVIRDHLVLFNRVPHYDRMDEIIVDGKVIGNLRYDINEGEFKMALRMDGAYFLNSHIKRGWVVVDDGAIAPILSGKNLMVPGVTSFAEDIKIGDEIIVRDSSGRAVAVGIAKMSSEDMENASRGVAVKIRHSGYGKWVRRRQPRIEDIIRANEEHLKKIEQRGVKFIKDISAKYDLPLAVSFSGGKDSLAVLLLAMESGIDFSVFFLNTGIELPETVEYVDEVEKAYGIKIDRIDAGNAFFDSLEHFGPPGRDYRWCCKACKLGPTTRYILERYPKGLLTLIGQRRYESFERMRKGSVWRNEWIPNQLSVSPIQNWTSFEVWLYILWKKAPINIWYKRGLTRIGCYLCPSSDLADFSIVREYFEGIDDWFSYLKIYARDRSIPEQWSISAWRWKNPPGWAGGVRVEREKLKVEFEGESWKSIRFNKEVDIDSMLNMLYALPEGSWRERDGEIEVSEKYEREARSLIVRSQECIGCGICLARCPVSALHLHNGKIKLMEDRCIHCLDCLGKCPVEEF